jgi:hypothetical protein
MHDTKNGTLCASVIAAGHRPGTAPRDAEWSERFFHLTDPDGHELSFAWPLRLFESADAAFALRRIWCLKKISGSITGIFTP